MLNIFLKKELPPLTILDIHQASNRYNRPLPLFNSFIQAGFPSPADDYIEKALDLNELVIQRPAATFYVKVQGDSMQDVGIFSGDILVVDRSLTAYHKSIIVAVLDGEFTVKRLSVETERTYLLAENSAYPPLKLNPESQFEVWGVVTYVIHKLR
ncbi:LexA family protein [Candidatus Protochlamydia sp. W-9]|uniref:LexA family protein n=1 Tax=Candidatus Protochlamydia sp. W-9 TaxID=1785087 RepID=UPI0009AC8D14|nr:translesion error-prone DNA polymerase V autoproteolytic subunit [Candidatus Protochlamydia sp. W-9]